MKRKRIVRTAEVTVETEDQATLLAGPVTHPSSGCEMEGPIQLFVQRARKVRNENRTEVQREEGMLQTAFERAKDWKLIYLKHACENLEREIARYGAEETNAVNAGQRAVAKGLREDHEAKLKELRDEEDLLNNPAGLNDRKKKALIANLDGQIVYAKGMLWAVTGADSRLNHEREIEAWESLLEDLIAED